MPPPASSTPALTHLVEADGTIETITHEITRLNGRKAHRQARRVSQHHLHPGLREADAQRSPRPQGGRPNRAGGAEARPASRRRHRLPGLRHDKQLVISFPSLEVGDVIEVKWTDARQEPRASPASSSRATLRRRPLPRRLRRDARPPAQGASPQVRQPSAASWSPKITEEGDYRTYHWRAVNCAQLPQDDNLPSKEELRLQVACSTFASWDEVGEWKQKPAQGLLEMHRRSVRKVVRGGHHGPEDAAGQGAGADLLGAAAHPLCLGRREARLHAAHPGPGA